MEPAPENVSGEVVRRHSFEHRVDWGYVALGLLGLYVAYKVASALESRESDMESVAGSDEYSTRL